MHHQHLSAKKFLFTIFLLHWEQLYLSCIVRVLQSFTSSPLNIIWYLKSMGNTTESAINRRETETCTASTGHLQGKLVRQQSNNAREIQSHFINIYEFLDAIISHHLSKWGCLRAINNHKTSRILFRWLYLIKDQRRTARQRKQAQEREREHKQWHECF